MTRADFVWYIIIAFVVWGIIQGKREAKRNEKKRLEEEQQERERLQRVQEMRKNYVSEKQREREIQERQGKSRQQFYNEEYLRSDAWQRKRYVVLKRDNWTCVDCGAKAVEVHHKRYSKERIGKEPIDWLVSVCNACHERRHGHRTSRTR